MGAIPPFIFFIPGSDRDVNMTKTGLILAVSAILVGITAAPATAKRGGSTTILITGINRDFCNCQFNAKAQRREGCHLYRHVFRVCQHITDTFAKKLSLWRCEVYQLLTSSLNMSTGDVLHFNVSKDNTTEFNHTVTTDEIGAGRFTQNATIECGGPAGICGDVNDDGSVDIFATLRLCVINLTRRRKGTETQRAALSSGCTSN